MNRLLTDDVESRPRGAKVTHRAMLSTILRERPTTVLCIHRVPRVKVTKSRCKYEASLEPKRGRTVVASARVLGERISRLEPFE
jgi:hypothetical protein